VWRRAERWLQVQDIGGGQIPRGVVQGAGGRQDHSEAVNKVFVSFFMWLLVLERGSFSAPAKAITQDTLVERLQSDD
jgi:hypothetical protein